MIINAFGTPVYKVAKIIDDRNLVITCGKRDGFKVGDCFEIYELGDTVLDPDNHLELGTLESVKATIRISQIYDKMAVCTNAFDEPSAIVQTMRTTLGTRSAPLNVAASDISGGFDHKIHVGDLVRSAPPLPAEAE